MTVRLNFNQHSKDGTWNKMNLMDTMNFNKKETLEQLRQGNKEVLKGLPATLILQLGIELQKEIKEGKEVTGE
ncbi:hypothetical protein BLX88_10915 [Bacillus obstructivus]|nr:hypothetical protein BLX88_10915 [Bacillus obstructivus]